MEKTEKVGRNELKRKPNTEKYLFNLQLIYTSLREIEIWDEFFKLIKQYSTSIVLKKNTGKVYLPPEQINEKVTNVCSKFMEQYLKSEDFKIEASFFGVLDKKAFEALYSTKNEDTTLSLNSLIADQDKDLETMYGTQFQNFLTYEEEPWKTTKNDILDFFNNCIDVAKEILLDSNRSKLTVAKFALTAKLSLLGKLTCGPRGFCDKKLYKEMNLSNKEKTALRLVKTSLFKEFA